MQSRLFVRMFYWTPRRMVKQGGGGEEKGNTTAVIMSSNICLPFNILWNKSKQWIVSSLSWKPLHLAAYVRSFLPHARTCALSACMRQHPSLSHAPTHVHSLSTPGGARPGGRSLKSMNAIHTMPSAGPCSPRIVRISIDFILPLLERDSSAPRSKAGQREEAICAQ